MRDMLRSRQLSEYDLALQSLLFGGSITMTAIEECTVAGWIGGIASVLISHRSSIRISGR